MVNIGIDLGGTNIAGAIVDESGKIIRRTSTPTLPERGAEAVVKDIVNICLQLTQEEGIPMDEIGSIGVGSPGIVDSNKGVVVFAGNLDFRNVTVAEQIQKHIQKPVYLENDANAAGYGEYIYGAGNIYKDIVVITLGTGVGGGIVLDGKIVPGSFNAGAELGHMVMVVDGEPCTCGRKGCWERYSSATGLIREAKKAADQNPESKLNEMVGGDLSRMNAKIPFDAAQAGDPVASKVVEEYIKYLAIGLANVINFIQPEAIILGGGVSAQGDKLIHPLKKRMIEEIFGGADWFKTEIKVAELGNDAGIIGAAMLHRLHP